MRFIALFRANWGFVAFPAAELTIQGDSRKEGMEKDSRKRTRSTRFSHEIKNCGTLEMSERVPTHNVVTPSVGRVVDKGKQHAASRLARRGVCLGIYGYL